MTSTQPPVARVKLRAVLVMGSVPSVAFDDLASSFQEQEVSGSSGASAVLGVVTL